MTFTVYVALDEAENVLYVGSTVDVHNRLTWHTYESPWVLDASQVAQIPCSDKASMLDLERRLIAAHNPPWNWQGRTTPNPRPKPTRAECKAELLARRSAPDYSDTAEFRLMREAMNKVAASLGLDSLPTERQSA